MFTPSLYSLEKLKYIANEMDGQPFHLHSHILYDIRSFLGDGEVNYLEVGVAYGMTAALVASHPHKTNCHLIDLGVPDGIDKIVADNVSKFKNTNSNYVYYLGDSSSPTIINQIKNNVSHFDFIFIDGLHTKEGVLNDFANYEPMLRSGGFLVFDDYLDEWDCPQVGPAIDEIVNENWDRFHIIGSIQYDFLSSFSDKLKSNNLFVMVKK